MVINLDSSAGGGTHCVACYVSKNQVEYVHSFVSKRSYVEIIKRYNISQVERLS